MTFRLAIAVYLSLWLAWLVAGYIRSQRASGGGGGEDSKAPQGRQVLFLLLWATVIIAIAVAWHVMHPGS